MSFFPLQEEKSGNEFLKALFRLFYSFVTLVFVLVCFFPEWGDPFFG